MSKYWEEWEEKIEKVYKIWFTCLIWISLNCFPLPTNESSVIVFQTFGYKLELISFYYNQTVWHIWSTCLTFHPKFPIQSDNKQWFEWKLLLLSHIFVNIVFERNWFFQIVFYSCFISKIYSEYFEYLFRWDYRETRKFNFSSIPFVEKIISTKYI